MQLQNKIPLIAAEQICLQTRQGLQKSFNKNVFMLQADLYSLGSLYDHWSTLISVLIKEVMSPKDVWLGHVISPVKDDYNRQTLIVF